MRVKVQICCLYPTPMFLWVTDKQKNKPNNCSINIWLCACVHCGGNETVCVCVSDNDVGHEQYIATYDNVITFLRSVMAYAWPLISPQSSSFSGASPSDNYRG